MYPVPMGFPLTISVRIKEEALFIIVAVCARSFHVSGVGVGVEKHAGLGLLFLCELL